MEIHRYTLIIFSLISVLIVLSGARMRIQTKRGINNRISQLKEKYAGLKMQIPVPKDFRVLLKKAVAIEIWIILGLMMEIAFAVTVYAYKVSKFKIIGPISFVLCTAGIILIFYSLGYIRLLLAVLRQKDEAET